MGAPATGNESKSRVFQIKNTDHKKIHRQENIHDSEPTSRWDDYSIPMKNSNIGFYILDTVNTFQNRTYSVGRTGSRAAGNRKLHDSFC